MKLIFALLLLTNIAFGQTNSLLKKQLKKDSIKTEFATLYDLTNTIHPGQFMYCTKKDFDKTYDSLQNCIKTDLSIVDYFKLTASLMAKIKDGHTATDRTQINELLKNKLVFPFSIYKIENKYYINKSANKDYERLIGKEILKINGNNIQSVIAKIKPYIHLEGDNETGLNIRLRNFPFYYFLNDTSSTFTVELKQETKQNIKGIEFAKFTQNTKQNIEPLSSEFIENKIGILKVHSFENGYDETERKKAYLFIDTFFSKMDSLKIDNLVLDLRDNGGGSPEIANYLFSYFTTKPYYYFDYVGAKYNSVSKWKHFAQYPENIEEINLAETTIRNGLNCYTATDSSDYWWFEQQENKSNYYKGKISVLIDGGCFSTTGHLLALFSDNKIGALYGEYSQGSNYSNSGGQAFVLPYSKTLVWIPTFQYKMKTDRKSTRLNSSHPSISRMPSSA